MNTWLVLDIGCLECEIPTEIVGIYSTNREAEHVANELVSSKNYGSDHSVEVFELKPELFK